MITLFLADSDTFIIGFFNKISRQIYNKQVEIKLIPIGINNVSIAGIYSVGWRDILSKLVIRQAFKKSQ